MSNHITAFSYLMGSHRDDRPGSSPGKWKGEQKTDTACNIFYLGIRENAPVRYQRKKNTHTQEQKNVAQNVLFFLHLYI